MERLSWYKAVMQKKGWLRKTGGGVFIYISYAFQRIVLWSANRKGKDIFQSIRKAPDFLFCFVFPERSTFLSNFFCPF